jgi:beta-N-acetylhexosaminidase
MMVAHLHIPALDSTPNRASTLSPAVVQKLLREEIRFEGLVFTDALNMKGVVVDIDDWSKIDVYSNA